MSTRITAHWNPKLEAFRDAVQGRLGEEIVELISRFVSAIVVRVQQEPLRSDHSLALSAPITGREKIHIGLFWTSETIMGTPRPRFLWSGFLPAGEQAHVLYTTCRGFVISVKRTEEGGPVTVSAMRQGRVVFSCFNGRIGNNFKSKRVDVLGGFFVVLDRV